MAKQTTSANGNKPVQTLRHRRLKATIWRNQTEAGASFYNVTLSRSYKDEEGWHESQSLGFDDLMNVVKLLLDTHSFISAQMGREGTGRSRTRENKPEVPAAFRH